MAMTGSGLADFIRSSMGFPTPVSDQLTGWGTGVVTHIQTAGLVNNAPGTIVGITAPGAPLSAGAGIGGLITGLVGPALATSICSNSGGTYPSPTSQLSAFCAQITLHIMAFGIVSFAPGDITGTCTNTPLTPGPLAGGAGANGKISGLSGSALAALVAPAIGQASASSELTAFCTAICDYIMNNAVVSYSTVVGVCPPGGGPLAAGAGIGGTIA